MFATQFAFNSSFNQYEIKVDGDKYQVTIEYLHKHQCRYNATRFSRYWLIELINPKQSVVDALDAKFNPMTTQEFLQLFNLVGYFDQCYTISEVKAEYRKLAKTMHPDCGGDADKFVELNRQYNQALTEIQAIA